jgi:S-adenosylmethionine:diacylglycerol 3-amino-3-carboxypropyl transferase
MQQGLNLSPVTPWHSSPFKGRAHGLVFGAMYEDPMIEFEAFPQFSRVFCIASAGCTARFLSAAGHEVTAVDINPQQIAYAQARALGRLAREGAAERLLSRGRKLFPLLGWTDTRLRTFLSMHDSSEQVDYWRQILDSTRSRIALDALLSRWVLGIAYRRPFITGVPLRFGFVVRARMERTWRNHPNDSNPYARRLFLGEAQAVEEPSVPAICFACADAASYLEQCAPSSFDAFSLSNIADDAPASYVRRLYRSVTHAAAADALVVTRSFAEPVSSFQTNLAARDRSMLWGTVYVVKARDLCCTY